MSSNSNDVPHFADSQGNAVGPAGLWVRFAASMIDAIIVAVVTFPIGLLQVMVFNKPKHEIFIWIVGTLIRFAIAGAYAGYFYSKKGATPGKSLLGLQVVGYHTGTHLSFGDAFYRDSVGKLVSSIILSIGFIMAGFRGDKRALHDLMANSQVVKVK